MKGFNERGSMKGFSEWIQWRDSMMGSMKGVNERLEREASGTGAKWVILKAR